MIYGVIFLIIFQDSIKLIENLWRKSLG